MICRYLYKSIYFLIIFIYFLIASHRSTYLLRFVSLSIFFIKLFTDVVGDKVALNRAAFAFASASLAVILVYGGTCLRMVCCCRAVLCGRLQIVMGFMKKCAGKLQAYMSWA